MKLITCEVGKLNHTEKQKYDVFILYADTGAVKDLITYKLEWGITLTRSGVNQLGNSKEQARYKHE